MRRLLKIGLALLAALAAGVLAFRARAGVETSLFKLVDSPAMGVVSRVAGATAARAQVIVEVPLGADHTKHVEKVLEDLSQPGSGTFKETLKSLLPHAGFLLSKRVRRQLAAGEYKEVKDEALARLLGPMPPLFGVKADPWLFLTDYVLSLSSLHLPGWTIKNNLPVRDEGMSSYALLSVDLSSLSSRRIAEFAAKAANHPPPVRLWCTGAAFHTAVTTERSKREINCLSFFSVLVVLAVGFWLFRTPRFLALLVGTLGFALLIASAALWAVFPRPHVITFVFGTSLIGLAVDYVYHACSARGKCNVLRPITLALFTTAGAFLPLVFAPLGVLKEMALFTVAGLVGAWGFVACTQVQALQMQPRERTLPRARANWRWLAPCVLLVLSLFGLPGLQLKSDVSFLYRPGEYLKAGEELLARLCPGRTGRWVCIKGDTLQAALEREEALGISGLSSFIPSFKRQRENIELVKKLNAAAANDYTLKTGIKISDEKSPPLLDPLQAGSVRLKSLVDSMWLEGALVSPCSQDFTSASEQVMIIEPGRTLTEVVGLFTAQACRYLGFSSLALVLLLAVCFRRRFLAHALPLVLALTATAGTLGLLDIDLTAFTLLAFLVVAGLGADYVIFYQSDVSADCARTVLGSFLTSFMALGALAFTGFAVTAAMGAALGIGLFYAWLFAWAFSRPPPMDKLPAPAAWHELPEQSAGRWRINFMWWVYRHLGKGALKILCVPVMIFIYPFARPARRALDQFHEVFAAHASRHGVRAKMPCKFLHLLYFAWSLVDKTDVCTLALSPPRVTADQDEGYLSLMRLLAAGKGAFLISSHLGTAEVLAALAGQTAAMGRRVHLHAFQSLSHNAEFTRFFLRNFNAGGFELHAVETIGVETAVQMQEAVLRGELVLMAGDRTSAGSSHKVLKHDFLSRPCLWPKGVFVFALLLDCPIYFVNCLRSSHNRYEAHFQKWRRPAKAARSQLLSSLVDEYVKFLEAQTCLHPGQWHQFYPFFSAAKEVKA